MDTKVFVCLDWFHLCIMLCVCGICYVEEFAFICSEVHLSSGFLLLEAVQVLLKNSINDSLYSLTTSFLSHALPILLPGGSVTLSFLHLSPAPLPTIVPTAFHPREMAALRNSTGIQHCSFTKLKGTECEHVQPWISFLYSVIVCHGFLPQQAIVHF